MTVTATSECGRFECAPNVLLVSVLEQAGVTPGGIVLPDTQREAPCQGIVEEAGQFLYEPKHNVTFCPKRGDRISMKRFGFAELTLNGRVLRQIGIADVLGIIHPPEQADCALTAQDLTLLSRPESQDSEPARRKT